MTPTELCRLVQQLSPQDFQNGHLATVDRARDLAGAIDDALVNDRSLDLAFSGATLALTNALTEDFTLRLAWDRYYFVPARDLVPDQHRYSMLELASTLVCALESDLAFAVDLDGDLDLSRARQMAQVLVRVLGPGVVDGRDGSDAVGWKWKARNAVRNANASVSKPAIAAASGLGPPSFIRKSVAETAVAAATRSKKYAPFDADMRRRRRTR